MNYAIFVAAALMPCCLPGGGVFDRDPSNFRFLELVTTQMNLNNTQQGSYYISSEKRPYDAETQLSQHSQHLSVKSNFLSENQGLALGIICKSCTPDLGKRCNTTEQLKEVNCDNELPPANLSQLFQGGKYDACYTSTIEVTAGFNIKIKNYAMNCGVKVDSSNPSVVNCSLTEQYVCSDARKRAAQSGSYNVSSCSSVCCDTKTCNALPTTSSPTAIANGNTTFTFTPTAFGNGNTTPTALASGNTTPTTTPTMTGGTSQVQLPLFGLVFWIAVIIKTADNFV